MKEKIITFCLMFTCVIPTYSEEVSLSVHNEGEGHDNNYEIPIHVDHDSASKLLRIDFKKSIDCFVVVSGPEGVVYQKSINARNYQTIAVDLKPYEEGDYEIVFYDKEGNVIDGSFYLKNSFKNLTNY
jgi:hypothetical protein